jgi:uncharacterized Zn finger protein (UPF0148 family)
MCQAEGVGGDFCPSCEAREQAREEQRHLERAWEERELDRLARYFSERWIELIVPEEDAHENH